MRVAGDLLSATEKQQDNWIKEGRGQGYLKEL